MRYVLAILLTLAVQHGLAQQPPACTLLVHADGFRNSRGKAGAALFRSAQGWPEDASRSLQHLAYPIDNSKSEMSFQGLAPGRYAVALFHDENTNGKLDRNFLGIPTEEFGFANNPKIRLGPPSFAAASIEVTCPVTEIVIHLLHVF
jgi:uncharacterized protein (DUF2141 family)